jgi:hypothetical protein
VLKPYPKKLALLGLPHCKHQVAVELLKHVGINIRSRNADNIGVKQTERGTVGVWSVWSVCQECMLGMLGILGMSHDL